MMMYFYPYKMATATEDNQLKSMLQVTGIDLDDLTVEQWTALSQMDLSALGSQVPGDGQNTEEKQMPGLDQSIDGTRIPGSDQSIDGTQIPGTAQDTDGSGMTLKSLMESMKDKWETRTSSHLPRPVRLPVMKCQSMITSMIR